MREITDHSCQIAVFGKAYGLGFFTVIRDL